MAEQKYIILEQLKKAVVKMRADYLALISQAVGGERLSDIVVTLLAENWNDNKQTVSDEKFLADSHYCYLACVDAENDQAYSGAGIAPDNIVVTGELTFKCTTIPKENITVDIIRLEVETDNE